MDGVTIQRAEKSDLRSILELQYLAYQSEARLLDDFTIPPLLQTLEGVEAEFAGGVFLKAVCGGRKTPPENAAIIGSVRGYCDGNTAFIGKLIVAPDMQGRGIGTALLAAVEAELAHAARYDNKSNLKSDFDYYELFTSAKSERTLRLYERLGYVRCREQRISDKLTLIFLEKKRKFTIGGIDEK